jgi:prepilin-type processing-associated H-X9-DG protein
MPIPFTCPHCGKSMSVDDKFAGQTGPCSSCQQPITIPFPAKAAASGGGGGWTTVLAVAGACLLGCLVCGGLVGLLLMPAMQITGGGGGQRTRSHNNLKQIMIALHNYHDVNGQFPPAVVKDADGKPLYSWRVLILPYIEQGQLFNQFDKTKAWDDPANLDISETAIEVFRSPLDSSLPPNGTSYFVLVGDHTAFSADRPGRLTDIMDGTSNTIGVVELKGISGSWAAPIDPKFESVGMSIGPTPGQLNPNGPNQLNVAMCDGSVRSLPATTPPMTLQLMFTRDDGMPVQIPD